MAPQRESSLQSTESTPPAAAFADSTSFDTVAETSGNWSNSAIWSDGVPGDGDNARIASDVSVTVDGETNRVKTLVVDGTLSFATDMETHLKAETVVTREGSRLEIGTESTPIQPDAHAHITFVHHEDISEKDHDPERISKGLITMGDVEIHGAEKTTWEELASAPVSGDTTIELAQVPTGWQEGDDIVVPGLRAEPKSDDATQPANEDEERTLTSISGTTVTLDEPLEYDHDPPENNLDRELTAYVLNLSRSVVMESEIKETDPTEEQRINRQGHVMIMTPASSVNYARFIHLGRTNKRYFTTTPIWEEIPDEGWRVPEEPNPLARYAFHYHETGIDEQAHEAEGLVAQNNPGWGIVNHHSHANVRDSITYRCLGAGFSSEAGDERGKFERCFALRSRGSGETRPDDRSDLRHQGTGTGEIMEFGFQGHGFWMQGPTVGIEDCVAAGHRSYGFSMWSQVLFDGGQYEGVYYDTSVKPLNFPVELAERDGLMHDELDYKRENNLYEREDGLVSTAELTFRSFTNNTAFASGGGFQYGGTHRPAGWGQTELWPTVESFTGYNFYRVRDRNGNEVRVRQALRGDEGTTGINGYRYANQLRVVDAQIVDNTDGTGISQSHYNGGLAVEDSILDCFRGVWLNDRDNIVLENLTLANDGFDIRNSERVKTTSLEMSDITSVDGGLNIHNPTGRWRTQGVSGHNLEQLFTDRSDTLDGRQIYYGIQDPDFVPFPTEGAIPGGNLGDVVGADDPSEVVGKTNQELQEEFGTSVYGELTPEEVKNVPYLNPGKIHPLTQPPLPFAGQEVTFDASAVVDTDAATSYEWTVGEDTTLTGVSPTHTFESTGQYLVELTTTMANGTTETYERHVTVDEALSDPRPADEPGAVASGLEYEYYEAEDSFGSLPDFDSLTPVETGQISEFSLGMDHRENNFAVRFTGYIEVPRTDRYTFWTRSDDGSKLYIGDQLVVNNGGVHAPENASGTIELQEGQHEITVTFFEASGGQMLRAYWANSLIGKQEIPVGTLSHATELDVSASGATVASGETATVSLSLANATDVTVKNLWTDWRVSVDNRGGADNANNRVDQASEIELGWNSPTSNTTAELTVTPPAGTYAGGTYAVEVVAENGESTVADTALIEIS